MEVMNLLVILGQHWSLALSVCMPISCAFSMNENTPVLADRSGVAWPIFLLFFFFLGQFFSPSLLSFSQSLVHHHGCRTYRNINHKCHYAHHIYNPDDTSLSLTHYHPRTTASTRVASWNPFLSFPLPFPFHTVVYYLTADPVLPWPRFIHPSIHPSLYSSMHLRA